MAETIEQALLSEAARERYLRYALSVITSRALPDVRDGLKPVQRRILYAMENDLGLGGGDAKPQKCAGVVGSVMKDYHPHGDQAIYDTMVRLAQDFSMRYRLVDGEGNFGSISGDPPAAYRYTECRLTAIASTTMALLGEQTVPFRPNYAATKEEPVVLPVPAPFLLANGTTGIAVGMATNVPPHNLGELAKACAHLIDAPEATVADLLKHVKGPDFPTSGEVLCKRADLRAIYETGRGSFKLRGTYKIEEGARGARSLVINSIPYGTTVETVIGAVAEIIRAKKLPHALDVRNETNADEGVRIVVELKKDSNPDELVAYLYKHTPLQANYGVNLTCLVPTDNPLVGRPEVLDLKGVLRHFLDFRFDVVTKSLQFRLQKLEERIHVLEGFEKVFDDIDGAIKIIRKAQDKPDAAAKLMKRFDLDDVQADAILELKLFKLAQLEIEGVRTELGEKRKEAARIQKLLKTDKPRWELIKKAILDYGEKFGDKRRTKLIFSDDVLVYDAEAYIAKEDTHVVLTRLGFVKRVRELKDPSATRTKEDDSVGWVLQGSTRAEAIYFSNQGTAFVAKINDAPATTGYGDPISKLFKLGDGERVVQAFSLDKRVTPPEDEKHPSQLLVATAQGHLLLVPLAPHRSVSTRAGRKFVRLGEGDEVAWVELVAKGAKEVLVATKRGYGMRVPLEEIPVVQGVGKGLKGVKLEKNDRVVVATTQPSLELVTDRGAVFKLEKKVLAAKHRGDEAVVVKERGGFERVDGGPKLIELPPEEDDGKDAKPAKGGEE